MSKTVPLVIYSSMGIRKVIGSAKVEEKDGNLAVSMSVNPEADENLTKFLKSDISHMSIDQGAHNATG